MIDLPFMPWYPRDFDDSTGNWPFVARGGYRELLDKQWRYGGLPADSGEMREQSRCPEADWPKAWRYIEPKFPICPDGLRRNPRLEEHRAESEVRVIKSSEHGRKGARARWGTRQDAQAMPEHHPEHMPGQCSPSPSPSPSSESSPSPSLNTKTKNARTRVNGADAPSRSRDRPLDGGQLAMLKAAYPTYSGRQDWNKASKAARKLIDADSATLEQLVKTTGRYALYVATKGREVMRPENFFIGDPPPCLQAWDLVPEPDAAQKITWRPSELERSDKP